MSAAGVDLGVALGPLRLKNPVLSGSGTFGYGGEVERFFDPGRLGAIVGKSITLEPREGNPAPRMAETAAGMLNAIGLQNPGYDRYVAEILPRMVGYGAPVVVNVAGRGTEDYEELARRLDGVPGVSALELNLSCPNVKEGGTSFSTCPRAAEEVCRRVAAATRLPFLAKLTPNVTSVAEIARACEAGGAMGVTCVNTLLGMRVDWRARRAHLATKTGGLSGPAVKPVAMRMVHEVSKAVSIPVVASGGAATADCVLEFLVAGATAVQVGTATFRTPYAIPGIIDALPVLLAEAGLARAADLIGTLA